jgi:hypothetical protein
MSCHDIVFSIRLDFQLLASNYERISDYIAVEFFKCLHYKHYYVYNVNKITKCNQGCGGNCQ